MVPLCDSEAPTENLEAHSLMPLLSYADCTLHHIFIKQFNYSELMALTLNSLNLSVFSSNDCRELWDSSEEEYIISRNNSVTQ